MFDFIGAGIAQLVLLLFIVAVFAKPFGIKPEMVVGGAFKLVFSCISAVLSSFVNMARIAGERTRYKQRLLDAQDYRRYR